MAVREEKRRTTRKKQRGGNLGPYIMQRMQLTPTRRKRTRKKRKGGALPLAAIVPGLVAAGKTVGLSALGGAASYGSKSALKKLMKRKRRKGVKR